jgi:uracil-DNA glycosylase
VKLRSALDALLAGWKEDLPGKWRAVLQETELDWTSKLVDREMWPEETILPGRCNRIPAAAPEGAHIFRAFQNTDPSHVRAVLLGQEPYPKRHWATGRAFEQGNLHEWPQEPHKVADSLRRIVQAMSSASTGDLSYAAGDHGWRTLIGDARTGRCRLPRPKDLFDSLERQGLLFLNTSLTVSVAGGADSPRKCQGHFKLWAPLISRVLSFLAGRERAWVVFLLFGRHAEAVFDRSGARTAAEHAKTWKTMTDVVRHFHPAAITKEGAAFLTPPNPFVSCNRLLHRMGAEPLSWGITRD